MPTECHNSRGLGWLSLWGRAVLVNQGEHRLALYDLAADLGEQKNVLGDATRAGRVQRMHAEFRRIRASRRSTPAR